eukprot:gene7545-7610_t
MLYALLTYPVINPVFFSVPFPWIGPLPIRWYALAYIGGMLGGWLYARWLVQQPRLWGQIQHPDAVSLDDLLVYAALGTIIGGRLGNVLFYSPGFYFAHPLEIFKLWEGGMAFHGGLIGVLIGMWLFARREKVSALSVIDLCAIVVPIGLFFGRLANFIRPELWGRPTDVPWAMIFPGVDGLPRHPSQLYEAGLEGLLLLLILSIMAQRGGLKRPGLIMGSFGILYGFARIISEFFREPDAVTEALAHGLTMGMVLSVPLIVIGGFFVLRALRKS